MNDTEITMLNIAHGVCGFLIGILLCLFISSNDANIQFKKDYNDCVKSGTLENVKRCDFIKQN